MVATVYTTFLQPIVIRQMAEEEDTWTVYEIDEINRVIRKFGTHPRVGDHVSRLIFLWSLRPCVFSGLNRQAIKEHSTGEFPIPLRKLGLTTQVMSDFALKDVDIWTALVCLDCARCQVINRAAAKGQKRLCSTKFRGTISTETTKLVTLNADKTTGGVFNASAFVEEKYYGFAPPKLHMLKFDLRSTDKLLVFEWEYDMDCERERAIIWPRVYFSCVADYISIDFSAFSSTRHWSTTQEYNRTYWPRKFIVRDPNKFIYSFGR